MREMVVDELKDKPLLSKSFMLKADASDVAVTYRDDSKEGVFFLTDTQVWYFR